MNRELLTVIPVVIGALGTIPKALEGIWKWLILSRENVDVAKKGKPYERNWISSNSNTKQHHKNQATALLRSAWILSRVLESRGDLPSLKLQYKKPIANADVLKTLKE